MRFAILIAILLPLAIAAAFYLDYSHAAAITPPGSPYLFIWSGNAAHQGTDFLSVIDANPASPTYAQVVATLPVGVGGTMPHHTEYEFPPDNLLFANGWVAGRTFIFDLHDPAHPQIAAQFTDRAGYSFPHSFVRLANGDRLGTFQSYGTGYAPGGGLVELDPTGAVVRSSSALDPTVKKDLIWPYSLAVWPERDLVIVTDTPMGWPDWAKLPPGSWTLDKINKQQTSQVQIFRLSDLHLLHTITLPADAARHDLYPSEAHVMPDGSIYLGTFRCGLYRMTNPVGPQPTVDLVQTFPGGESMSTNCAVPTVVGHYWVQTAAALPGVIVLDITNPAKPVEVSRLVLDHRYMMPHWLAADRKSDSKNARLILTGDDLDWALVLRLDEKGQLTIDRSFRDSGSAIPGLNFTRDNWPHGNAGPAVVHAALFGPA